jgi:hypothetical protein
MEFVAPSCSESSYRQTYCRRCHWRDRDSHRDCPDRFARAGVRSHSHWPVHTGDGIPVGQPLVAKASPDGDFFHIKTAARRVTRRSSQLHRASLSISAPSDLEQASFARSSEATRDDRNRSCPIFRFHHLGEIHPHLARQDDVLHADRLDLEAEVRHTTLDVLGVDLIDHDLVLQQLVQSTRAHRGTQRKKRIAAPILQAAVTNGRGRMQSNAMLG